MVKMASQGRLKKVGGVSANANLPLGEKNVERLTALTALVREEVPKNFPIETLYTSRAVPLFHPALSESLI